MIYFFLGGLIQDVECAGKGFQFDDQGEATLKGFPEPVRLFVVGEGA